MTPFCGDADDLDDPDDPDNNPRMLIGIINSLASATSEQKTVLFTLHGRIDLKVDAQWERH